MPNPASGGRRSVGAAYAISSPPRRGADGAAPSRVWLIAVIVIAATSAQADDEHHDAPTARVAVLERFGVTLATSGPGIVDPGLELPGEIRPDATRTAHVAARFAGVARSVRARVGEAVRQGDVLAVIESQTLAPYELRAPFDGVIINSLLVPGESADPATPAFVV